MYKDQCARFIRSMMPKIKVRPAASRNSKIPNCNPLSVCSRSSIQFTRTLIVWKRFLQKWCLARKKTITNSYQKYGKKHRKYFSIFCGYNKSGIIWTLLSGLNCGREVTRFGGTRSPSKNRNATRTFYNPLRKDPGDLCKRFSQYWLCSFLQNL